MTRHLLRLGLLVGLLTLLAACDSGNEPGVYGSFDVTLTGAVEAELQGDAIISESPDVRSGIKITMAEDGIGPRAISIVDAGGVLLGEGEYPVVSDDLDGIGLLYLDRADPALGALVSTGGTVRITRYEAERISGSFIADLESVDGTAEMRAEGTFDAVPLPGPL